MRSFKSNLKKANFHRCTRATSIELNKQLAVSRYATIAISVRQRCWVSGRYISCIGVIKLQPDWLLEFPSVLTKLYVHSWFEFLGEGDLVCLPLLSRDNIDMLIKFNVIYINYVSSSLVFKKRILDMYFHRILKSY